MGYREEELKARGQRAMVDVDQLKRKIQSLELEISTYRKEINIMQEQLQNSYIRIKELTDQKSAALR
jgi:chaperonin cofactor prefoldin